VDQLLTNLQFIMHIGDHLGEYGAWAYGILSAIIFAETGFVIFPFLPGDTLLFTAGAFCASGHLSIVFLNLLIITSAIAGNTVNYWVAPISSHKN
jgi:membrane-associated protein